MHGGPGGADGGEVDAGQRGVGALRHDLDSGVGDEHVLRPGACAAEPEPFAAHPHERALGVGAGGEDDAAALCARDGGQVGQDAELSVEDVEVEVGDRRRLHPYEGVPGLRLGDRPLHEARQGAELLQDQGSRGGCGCR